jgi:hypothetical protein
MRNDPAMVSLEAVAMEAAKVTVHELRDVYARFYSCRQCWASKCRGL